jgi:transcription initiation factor IIE alpha subunit
MTTKTLITWVDEHHARNSDPETSHESAKAARSFAKGHALKCLDALKELGCATQSEIATCAGLLPHQVNKRLADLHRNKFIVPTGKTRTGHTNRQEREWKVV